MSEKKQKKSQNVVVVPEPTEETVPSENSESDLPQRSRGGKSTDYRDYDSNDEEEVIELTKADKKPPAPTQTKSLVERKREGLARARAILQGKREAKRAEDAKARKLIEKSYEAEMEEKLMKETIPKYSKQIKRQILEKLKQRKLEELKKTYGYESSESESESESDSDSEEEEVVVRRKQTKAVVVPTKKREVKASAKPAKVLEAPKPQGIMDKMRFYGF